MNIIKVKNKDVEFIDENILNEWYDKFNKEYFDDMLDKNPDIQIINKKNHYYGYCTYNKKQILMNDYNLNNRYILYIQNIFIHEMIHMMQGNLGYNKGHGKSFLDKAKEINKKGWNIKVHVDEDELRFINKLEEGKNIEDCIPLMDKTDTNYIINLIKEIYDYKGIEYNIQDIEDKLLKNNNEIDDILDIIESDDTLKNSDWEEFKKWKNDKAIWKTDKEGDKICVVDCFDNVVGFIENFPKTKNKIKFNNVRNIIEYNGRQVVDKDYHDIIGYICKYFLPTFSKIKMVKDAVDNVGFKNKFNPWTEYFDNLVYEDDGIDYIDYTIKEVLCCEDQDKYYDLYYETLKIMLLANMSRIYNKELYGRPTKYDTVVAICGENGGSGKTTFFERLYDINNNGNTYCYVVAGDTFNPKDRDFIERTHQSVCLFLDEVSMKRSIVTSVKGYITQRDDRFRKAYGFNSESHMRGFIITASSNNTDILKDYTTNNERRWAIIKISENEENYENVNKAFDNGFRDKLWGFIKNIYENEEFKLYMTDKRLIKLEEEIQRGYKASNNVDYNTIIDDLMEREYGFIKYDGKIIIDTNFIVEQYNHGDSYDWCLIHNHEVDDKLKTDKYIMRPEDRKINVFGKIDRISKKQLYDILDKLKFEWTKPTLNAEIKYRGIWDGCERGKNACKINGTLINSYWRKEKIDPRPFEGCKSDTVEDNNLPF